MDIITSWDDGRRQDLRMADLLRKYNLPGIFFLPDLRMDLLEEEVRVLAKDFEIGGHTTTHPADMKLLTKEQQIDEVLGNKEILEKIIGKRIEWFCYPRGRYNDITIEVVKEVGYKYARTTKVLCTEQPIDNYRIETSVHVFDNRTEYDGKGWLEVAKEQYLLAKNKENSVYHIWGHSWEITQFSLWGELEELFIYIKERN